jgi:hypothetical protein
VPKKTQRRVLVILRRLGAGCTRCAMRLAMLSAQADHRIRRHVRQLTLTIRCWGSSEFQVEYRTDVYAEQRGLEQMLYDQ